MGQFVWASDQVITVLSGQDVRQTDCIVFASSRSGQSTPTTDFLTHMAYRMVIQDGALLVISLICVFESVNAL
jgi:hypothetical protein